MNYSDQKLKPGLYEKKWRDHWLKARTYQPDLASAKKPFYNLMMFPYPSAEGLHVGNMYAFTGVDIYGRFMRMKGYDVFEPIGLDGFGIHSENYALKLGKNPREQAGISEKNFYRQLLNIGNGFAWENRLETYDPDYYKWTQWLFVQMFKHGLAYRKKSAVNFCPSCKTVVSDEQVIEGKCERCKTEVVKKDLEQWFFKITAYADKLLQNTYKESFKWSDKVKIGQQNWIGKKTGINIKYQILNTKFQIECFTTRPDTNFGATFVVIAPEHEFAAKLQSSKFKVQSTKLKEINDYIEKTKKKTEAERIAEGREKTGVFTGFYCINSLNGAKLPIYISDFVLKSFGTGAVVGVPGHDERDFDFARKFNIPIKKVVDWDDELHCVVNKDSVKSSFEVEIQKLGVYIQSRERDYAVVTDKKEAIKLVETIKQSLKNNNSYAELDGTYKGIVTKGGIISQTKEIKDFALLNNINPQNIYLLNEDHYIFCFTGEGKIVNSDFLNGLNSVDAIKTVIDYLQEKGWGKRETTFRLRDWCVSRQRYWGAPIPMIFCEKCAKKASEIPNSQDQMFGWYPVHEEQLPVILPDLKDWKPEGTGKGPLAKLGSFVNVKCPECGSPAQRETDVCDTFLDSSWYFLRYPTIGADNSKKAPFNQEITRKWLPVDTYIGGAEHTVLHLLYSRFVTMTLKDFGFLDFEEPYKRFYAHGLIIAEGAKMSKSRGNVIIPDIYIEKYGADTLRTYLMFLGPFDMGGDFRDTGIAGMYKFLGRVWRIVNEYIEKNPNSNNQIPNKDQNPNSNQETEIMKIMHKTIKEVTEDLENLRYNTAIAHIMEYVNKLQEKLEFGIWNLEFAKVLLLLLAPFAPYMTEELWQKITEFSSSDFANAMSDKQKTEKNRPTSNFQLPTSSFRSIHLHPWPSYDPKYLVEDEVTIVVQVNGKLRESFKIKNQKSKIRDEVESLALSSEKVKKHLEGKKIRKVIFVPGKLINFVV